MAIVIVWPKKAHDWSNFCHVFLKIYVQFTWLVIMSSHGTAILSSPALRHRTIMQ
jgi:hypothetical protein